jgi:hypothetical protein
MSQEHRQSVTPFWDSAPFWGFVSLVATILFTVLGVRMKDLSWLFIAAWVCCIPAAIIVCKRIKDGWIRFITVLLILLCVGAGLGELDKVTKPKDDRARVTLVWKSPEPINYGTPLSSRELNATASVDGKFVYNPTYGSTLPVGIDTLSVSFAPEDSTRYQQVTKTVSIEVKAPSQSDLSKPTHINPIGLIGFDPIPKAQSGMPLIMKFYIKNNLGESIEVHERDAVYVYLLQSEGSVRSKAEDELWARPRIADRQQTLPSSPSMPMFIQLKTGVMGPEILKRLENDAEVVYFMSSFTSVHGNKRLFDLCGYVNSEGTFTLCVGHNWP